MNAWSRIAELEQGIATVYRWFAENAPGVTPKEEGHLGMMWEEADALYVLTDFAEAPGGLF